MQFFIKVVIFLILYSPFSLRAQWTEVFSLHTGQSPSLIVTANAPDSLAALVLWDSILISTNYGMDWQVLQRDSNAGYTHFFIDKNQIAWSKWDTLFVSESLGKNFIYKPLSSFIVTEFSLINHTVICSEPFFTIKTSNNDGASWLPVDVYDDPYFDYECWQSGSPHCHSIRTSGNFMGINGNNIFYNLNQVEYGEGEVISATDKGLHKSWNDGKDWIPLNIYGVNHVAFYYPKIFAATENGLFRSDDYGKNWFAINPNPMKTFTILGHNIIGLIANQIAVSNDLGNSWQYIDQEPLYNELSHFTLNNRYAFASKENKIYRKDMFELPLALEESIAYDGSILTPNPTRGYLRINNPSIVSYTVYNVIGVPILANQAKDYINLAGLSNGIYIIALKNSTNQIQIEKIVKN